MLSLAEKSGAFVLASVITRYPDSNLKESLEALLADASIEKAFRQSASADWEKLVLALKKFVSGDRSLEDWASQYIDVFDRGRGSNPLYETEYNRERTLVKANDLVDIAGFYKAFGLELVNEDGSREMLDHVSVELEFYALLLMKQALLTENGDETGVAVVEDARKKFLKEHLGRFVGAIAERPGVVANPFFAAIFGCCKGLIQGECRELGVEPLVATWILDGTSESDVSCGGSVGCVKTLG